MSLAVTAAPPVALFLVAIAGGCGSHGSGTPNTHEGAPPPTSALVFLATALPCKAAESGDAHFTPLVVRGPGYTTTIMPQEGCREQPRGWRSYVYDVPVPESGQVKLTPGNQPTATLSAAKAQVNRAATIYYVNCAAYYSVCPKGDDFVGRIRSIEYFKDEDVG